MSQAHVHMHKRKTKNKKQTAQMRLLDKLVIVMGIVNLFATLPQVIAVWGSQGASGVSSFTWGYYVLFSAVLLAYGLLHNAKPIVASYTGSVVVYAAVFVGSLVY